MMFKNLKPNSIKTKVALPIAVVGVLSGVLVGYYTYSMEIDNAIRTSEQQIKTALTFSKASREYVRNTLRPKINELLASGCSKEDFILEGQSSSFFTASIFKKVNEELPDFQLRQVAYNPLNPKDEPDETEAKIIAFFRSTSIKEYKGILEKNNKRYFNYALPVIPDTSCLVCHGRIEAMPKTVYALYKPAKDLNWEVGKVQGAVIVSIPFEEIILKAQLNGLVKALMAFGLFLVIVLFILLALDRMVFKPIEKLEKLAEEIAKGNVDKPVDITSDDEIGKLAQAFERMRVSIKKVMDLLK